MKNKLIILVFLLASHLLKAQSDRETFLNVQLGLGGTVPYYSVDEIVDNGFFMQGEYIVRVRSWIEVRPYLGLILTKSDGNDINGNPTTEKATSRAGLMGGKGRIRAPIPWVAPYIEAGLGASIGKFETFTAFTDSQKRGPIYHIPISFGLELGRNHSVDLGVSYYLQPGVEQFVGALALGISFPL